MVAGQQVNGDFGERREDAERFVHESVGDLIVLEQVARDEEGVDGAVAREVQRGAQGDEALGAEAFGCRRRTA